ncbi:MAG: FAD binding domain-containing protein [Proteobacteria bacterium]|nr:FAD binding domain-containing protein [Pseudomonadota bacterium]
MRLPPFEVLEPATLKNALSMLEKHKGKVKVIAGGIEIVGLMKLGLSAPPYILSLRKIKNLQGIKKNEGQVIIRSNTTLREIIESSLINDLFKGISQAANLVAAPPIQNRATIGGNILQNSRCMYHNQSELFRNGLKPCYKTGGDMCRAVKGGNRCFSVYQSDMAPALISFNAKARLEKTGSSRTILISDLFTGKGENPISIGENELLTDIIIPIPKGQYSSAYEKLRIRKSLEYPLMSSAVFMSGNKNGEIIDACIVLGAAGSYPKIIDRASKVLKEKKPSDKDIEEASRAALQQVEVADNLPVPASYRRKMAIIYTKRAIQKALKDLRKDRQL